MLLIFCAASVIAQTTTNIPPADNPVVDANDQTIRAFLTKYSLVKLLIVPFVTILVMAVRRWIGYIPDQVWPWATPIIGALLDYAGSKAGFWTDNVTVGAAMGGLATWFHQIGAQTREVTKKGFTYSKSSKPGDEENKSKK